MMTPEERAGRDIWDKVRMQAAAQQQQQQPKPVMEWPNHYPPFPPKSPSQPGTAQGDRARLGGPYRPRPKPTPAQQQQGPISPRPLQPPRPRRVDGGWTGQGSANAYDDPKSSADLMRGAYQAGLNGDAGAAGSFPPGSAAAAAYQRGLADRKRRDQSMKRYRPEAG